MLSSSQDLLYIVLSLSILWFTIFLCWLLYQAGATLRNVNRMVEHLLHKLELIADAMHFIRGKVDNVSGSLLGISGMIARLVEKMIVGTLTDKLENRSRKRKAASKGDIFGDGE
ncbi:MAG: hypothetical protein AAB408_01200 [Patescibacteria group bacterium]